MDEGVRLVTTRGVFRKKVEVETTGLDDLGTIRRWVRELRPGIDQAVHVDRKWGTLTASGYPVTIEVTDGERSWVAAGSPVLTPRQVETLVVAALTSADRPDWPSWV